jgi:hypothetical protein
MDDSMDSFMDGLFTGWNIYCGEYLLGRQRPFRAGKQGDINIVSGEASS